MLSDAGVQCLIASEGLVTMPYLDPVGLPTVGIGHLLKPEERKRKAVWLGGQWVSCEAGLTRTDCIRLMQQDVGWAMQEIERLVTVPLTQGQQDALISWTYNVGSTALEHSTLLKVLNQGDYAAVPKQMKRWIRAGGRVLPGLVARREREAALWRS